MASSSAITTFFPISNPCPSSSPQKIRSTFVKPLYHRPIRTLTATAPIKSIDVSKDDKQLEQPISPSEEDDSPTPPPPENLLDKRRLEEKFAVVNTGLHECRSCGYNYNESSGDPSYPIPPGLPFDRLPDDWRCPTCGASQSFFQSKSLEVAGFAENQQFGLGGNTLTSGQKALLIYGGLLLGFALFLSGYFLQ